MAFCVIKFTRRQRFFSAVAFSVLNIIQMILGLSLTSHAFFIYITISPNLYTEKAEVTFVFVITGMYGTHVIFHYLLGMKIVHKCYKQAHKKSTRRFLFLWTLAGTNTIVNLLILASMYVQTSRHIIRSLRHSLEKGMHKYLLDDVWKITFDKIQYNFQCCGIDSYGDWHKIGWLTSYHVNENSDLVKELRVSKNHLHLPVTPWSCCRLDYPMQCLHDPLQQTLSVHIWADQPDVVLDSVHNQGCLEALRIPLLNALMAYIFLIMIVATIHVVIIVLSRFVFSSCRNSVLLRTHDVAPGWLFGRGDCGYKKGRTVSEIMQDTIKKNEKPVGPETHPLSQDVRPAPRPLPEKKESKSPETSRSQEDPVSSRQEEDLLLT